MLGVTLGLHVGPAVPTTLDATLLESVAEVSVTQQDTGRSGFQVTLVAGRDRETGVEDFPPLLEDTFRIGNRVQITAALGVQTHVLMDGFITNQQLAPGAEPNASRLTITGEDVSVMMDLHEVSLPFPAMPSWAIATTLLGAFSWMGLVPTVIPEPALVPPIPTEEVPHKKGTALGILNALAEEWGYVFYVAAGPTRGANVAYWGPPIRAGVPQRALTWRMGPATNLGSIQFQVDGTKPTAVYGLMQERIFDLPIPILSLPYPSQPLATWPATVKNQPLVGLKRLECDKGGDAIKALWTATSQAFRANRGAVSATGELDVSTYGDVLAARSLVDVRGVGKTMDGTWYVQSTTHTLSRGSWKQSFKLERGGTVALSDHVTQV